VSLQIKEVIQIARAQFKELLPELAIQTTTDVTSPKKGSVAAALKGLSQTTVDIRLEEIEKEGENWAVTFSVPNPNYSPDALLAGIRSARNLARIAKVIVVDGSEGKLVALRERAA
jgi:glycerate kinase